MSCNEKDLVAGNVYKIIPNYQPNRPLPRLELPTDNIIFSILNSTTPHS